MLLSKGVFDVELQRLVSNPLNLQHLRQKEIRKKQLSEAIVKQIYEIFRELIENDEIYIITKMAETDDIAIFQYYINIRIPNLYIYLKNISITLNEYYKELKTNPDIIEGIACEEIDIQPSQLDNDLLTYGILNLTGILNLKRLLAQHLYELHYNTAENLRTIDPFNSNYLESHEGMNTSTIGGGKINSKDKSNIVQKGGAGNPMSGTDITMFQTNKINPEAYYISTDWAHDWHKRDPTSKEKEERKHFLKEESQLFIITQKSEIKEAIIELKKIKKNDDDVAKKKKGI